MLHKRRHSEHTNVKWLNTQAGELGLAQGRFYGRAEIQQLRPNSRQYLLGERTSVKKTSANVIPWQQLNAHGNGFLETVICALLFCFRKKEKVGSSVNQPKTAKGQLHKIYEDLYTFPEKIFSTSVINLCVKIAHFAIFSHWERTKKPIG
jgi:hypothetical protein